MISATIGSRQNVSEGPVWCVASKNYNGMDGLSG